MAKRAGIEIQIADLHIGSTLGLCPTKGMLDLGGAYEPNQYQRWLLRQWGACWDDAQAWIAEKEKQYGGKLEKHLSVLGDAGDVDAKGRSRQIWARDASIVVRAAATLLEPIVAGFDDVHFIKGTEAHGGPNNDVENLIADDLGGVPCSETGEAAWWYADVDIGGVLFDLQHHGRLGGRSYTQGNPLTSVKVDVVQFRLESGDRIPTVISRAHRHFFDETSREKRPYVVSLPGWQHTTAFGHRIDAAGRMPECGIVCFYCHDGEFEVEVIRKVARRPAAWRQKS